MGEGPRTAKAQSCMPVDMRNTVLFRTFGSNFACAAGVIFKHASCSTRHFVSIHTRSASMLRGVAKGAPPGRGLCHCVPRQHARGAPCRAARTCAPAAAGSGFTAAKVAAEAVERPCACPEKSCEQAVGKMHGACQSFRELRATSPHRARAAVGWKGRASHVTGHELQHDGGDDGRREHGVVPAGGQGQWSGVRHSGTGRLVQA